MAPDPAVAGLIMVRAVTLKTLYSVKVLKEKKSSKYTMRTVTCKYLYIFKNMHKQGCSSIGSVLHRHATDAGSIPQCRKEFFL